MTPEQWLKIPEDKLLPELQKFLPGLQKIDWNTAMERRPVESETLIDILAIEYGTGVNTWEETCFDIVCRSQPKHYLIAIVMAMEGKEE